MKGIKQLSTGSWEVSVYLPGHSCKQPSGMEAGGNFLMSWMVGGRPVLS
jgi:hypothetical protein